MEIFTKGNAIDAIILLTSFIIFYVLTYLAKKGRVLQIRRIAALDAIDELVRRCLELNRPIHFTTGGSGSLDSQLAPQLLAGVAVLSYTAKICAELDANLIVYDDHVDLLPLIVATVDSQYRMVGKETPIDTIRYIPSGYSYTLGVSSAIKREKVAANIMVGPFAHEAVMLAQAGVEAGATQIAGTGRTNQLVFFAAICDYVLLPEDMYAAGALIYKTPESVGSIVGEDPFKIASFVLIILGAILATFNISWLTDILKL